MRLIPRVRGCVMMILCFRLMSLLRLVLLRLLFVGRRRRMLSWRSLSRLWFARSRLVMLVRLLLGCLVCSVCRSLFLLLRRLVLILLRLVV